MPREEFSKNQFSREDVEREKGVKERAGYSCAITEEPDTWVLTCSRERGQIMARLIDFETTDIQLAVTGTTPNRDAKVELSPRQYVTQPEYWGIEVVETYHGMLPSIGHYSVSISLEGIVGTKGIEVIGATRSEKRDVPPKKKG